MGASWHRTRWGRTVLGLLAGAAAGSLVFLASQLSGWPLYTLAGATAGLVAALSLHTFSRNAQLSEITLTIPQVSQLQFIVTRDTQQVAWKLFVQAATRISTRPMDRHSGLLREALTSLHGFFQTTRELLMTIQPSPPSGDGPSVEQLGMTMLNRELSPFLSRWHVELLRWERANEGADEAEWPANAACREELAALQDRVAVYALGFAKLAGVPDSMARTILGRED